MKVLFLPEEMIVAVFVLHPPDHYSSCLLFPSPFLDVLLDGLLDASFLSLLFRAFLLHQNALHSSSRLLIVESTMDCIGWRRKEYPCKEKKMMERKMMTG